ncbi:hypothetical protein GCM10009548_85410 [Streptomyces malaysiensis subsp. malaysiensis]|uniref:MFS transporter n=1 Tax=Streptomyces malaysiensis TaxID=92644 RepID=A0ABX6WGS2_STRMQ|nr:MULTISPECIES: hypothetical protein [Streptomyces]QPI60642.1 hypothetical protein I1A49_42095 [Streptomyces solisilvae]UHH22363.1 hypothetical protein LUV23_42265 [Streptomyces sp. HNM0561]
MHDVAEGKRQESWFALITTLRNAGLGVGALGASLAVAIGGTNGYTAIVAVNAVSFAVAAVLTRLGSPGGDHAVTVGELIQGLIVAPIVNDRATAASRGRYNSLSQMAFSVGDVVTPALMTMLLAHGPLATWLPARPHRTRRKSCRSTRPGPQAHDAAGLREPGTAVRWVSPSGCGCRSSRRRDRRGRGRTAGAAVPS